MTPAPNPQTNAWRTYHDARAGVWIDSFDGRWLVQTRDSVFPNFIKTLNQGLASSVYWKARDKSASTTPKYIFGRKVSDRFLVRENGATFSIDFSAGYSSGIFLDQRLNRRMVGNSVQQGQRFLNTFAYTGAFSVMAAKAGAETTTLDLSKNYLNWTWENFRANGLDPKDHFGCKGDTFEWLKKFAKQGRTFHGIVLDPPTFSRMGKKTFSTDRDYASLVKLAAAVTEPGGWILCCANTQGMNHRQFEAQIQQGIKSARRQVIGVKKLEMPPEFNEDDYLKSLRVDVG